MDTSSFIHRDAFRMLTDGDTTLGSGVHRTVFPCALNDAWVVKVEEGSRSFANVLEWETWERVRDTPWAKWFAPCHHISPCGSVLLMSRTQRLRPEEYPEQIPGFFTDTKRDNFGLLGKQFVCHDYGLHLLMEQGMHNRMRKVKWW